MPNESDLSDLKNMTLDLEHAKDSVPNEAPVSDPEPLTGKEKAGVSLTWGIIGVSVTFLFFILSIFIWGEAKFFIGVELLEGLKPEDIESNTAAIKEFKELYVALESQRTSFRTFWFDTLQLVLLNVLFPTLTALLGYVFGTSKNNNS
jgi:hypothetical protein